MGSLQLSTRPLPFWSVFQLSTTVVLLFLLMIACDSGGSSMSPEPEPGDEEPDALVELTAENDGEEVQLSWTTENVEAADNYRIYRDGEARFDTTGAFYASVTDTTAYRDTSVQVDQLYHYRVAAMDDEGSAAAVSSSDYARPEDVTAPKTPANAEGAGGFYKGTLTWDPVAADDLGGYRVYRSTESFSDVAQADLLTSSPVDTAGYVDDTALDGTRYFYRITAVDENRNESAPSSEVTITPTFSGDALRGEELFLANCSTCHISSNAWDLQAFTMPDTMIHRRATKHVTEQEALDIIEFVRVGDVQPLPDADLGKKELPPFQPRGRILSSDRAFAMNLFGQDEWPADLKPEDLRDMDLTQIPIPFRLPDWNIEHDESDWLPTEPLPDRIAEKAVFRSSLQQYRSNPSDINLLNVYSAVHEVSREGADRYPPASDPPQELAEVYELNRWISSLVGLHALRMSGDEAKNLRRLMNQTFRDDLMGGRHWSLNGKYRSLVSEMWAVGDIMRKHGPDMQAFRLPEEYGTGNREIKTQAVQWFYLAWMLRSEAQTDFDLLYFPRLLSTAGYPRVAAFFAAYAAANTQLGIGEPYNVAVDFPASVHGPWIPNLLRFMMDAYVDRIERGDELHNDHDSIIHHLRDGVMRSLDQNEYITDEDRSYIRDRLERIVEFVEEQKRING